MTVFEVLGGKTGEKVPQRFNRLYQYQPLPKAQ
jgi:hypothetical protein